MENSETLIVARHRDLSSSGVSWGAVIAGAFVAAALSLIMLALGAGFGLSAISPWSNVGASASTVGTAAIAWFIVMQIVASAMGGYLTGRLRTRWQSLHNDEVHFRDTANGFVAWAVGVVLTVSFLVAGATTMVGGAAKVSEDSKEGTQSDQYPTSYFVDRMFRSDRPGTDKDLLAQSEAVRIFGHFVRDVPSSDRRYLTQLVAAKGGLNPDEAAARVSQTIADIRQAEDDARKATAHILLWIFIALLTGAFCASFAATVGGRQRDRVQMI
jgi:hypothetical protein